MPLHNDCKIALSLEKDYSEGYFASAQNNSYFLGINYSVAKVEKRFSHDGSSGLDQIHSFDTAEIEGAHIGQTNLIQVSSFCGPRGKIWGLDVCKTARQVNPWDIKSDDIGARDTCLWDMKPLANAFAQLTGTVDLPRFPFLPGSHVPCALKYTSRMGPCTLYVAQSCGIPRDRSRNACLLMEDFGTLPDFTENQADYIRNIMINLGKSVLAVGKTQKVEYSDIFMGFKKIDVGANEMGCALAADPYFLLAQDAVPADKSIFDLSLKEWEDLVSDNYLYKK